MSLLVTWTMTGDCGWEIRCPCGSTDVEVTDHDTDHGQDRYLHCRTCGMGKTYRIVRRYGYHDAVVEARKA